MNDKSNKKEDEKIEKLTLLMKMAEINNLQFQLNTANEYCDKLIEILRLYYEAFYDGPENLSNIRI